MSRSAWWKHAFKLNTIDGPVLPPLPPRPRSQPPTPGVEEAALRADSETVAQSAEENHDFLSTHQEAFEILARNGWEPHNAWNYLWNLGAASRWGFSHSEVLRRARVARELDGMEVNVFMRESDLDVPDEFRSVVLRLVVGGHDVDYLQAFAYCFDAWGFSPRDMWYMLEDADRRVMAFNLVPGLRYIYGEGPPLENVDDGDEEMGSEDEETANEDEDMGDEAPLSQDDDGSDFSEEASEDIPVEDDIEILTTPSRRTGNSPVSNAERDDMVALARRALNFTENGTVPYVARVDDLDSQLIDTTDESSLPDYRSPTPPCSQSPQPYPEGPPLRDLYPEFFDEHYRNDTGAPSETQDSQADCDQCTDEFDDLATDDLDERLGDWEQDDGRPQRCLITPPPVEDLRVAAGRPSPPPPGGGCSGQVESPNPDDGLILRLRGGRASSSGSPRKSSSTSSRVSSRFPLSPDPAVSRAESDGKDDDDENDHDEHHDHGQGIQNDEPADDDDTDAKFQAYNEAEAVDNSSIHDQVVAAQVARNNDFVATRRAVFSVLAADSWTPQIAWRCVNWLNFVTGGNSTNAELIQMVTAIDEGELYHKYTYVEEEDLIEPFAADSQLADRVTTAYRAGFDAEYIRLYCAALWRHGRSAHDVEDELNNLDADDVHSWLWRWAPAMQEIWHYAGQTTTDAPLPSLPSTTPACSRAVPTTSQTSSSRSPQIPNGNRPYSPSYPPVVPSSDATVPDSFDYTSPYRSRSVTSQSQGSLSRSSGNNTPTSSKLARDRNLSSASSGTRSDPIVGGFLPHSPPYEPSPVPSWRSRTPLNSRTPSAASRSMRSPAVSELAGMSIPSSPAPGSLPNSDRQFSAPSLRRGLCSARAASQPRGILKRPNRIPFVDPLRYTNRLRTPRRLPDTPTRSHQPPSPRRNGPRTATCGECGRPYGAGAVAGGVVKTSSPAVKQSTSSIIRETPSPVVKKSASPATRKTPSPAVRKSASPVVKKASSSSPASSASSGLSSIAKTASSSSAASSTSSGSAIAVVKVPGRKSAATKAAVRRSGRTTRKPDRFGEWRKS